MSASPRLAWELIERIICHSGDDPDILCSFSLTCSQLRPRSLCLMVADVEIRKREQVAAFRDFLESFPHLCPFVRSVTTDPAVFTPFPLLYILPSLSKFTWITNQLERHDVLSLPLSVLTCFRRFGTNITALYISDLHFKTLQDFCRVLLAFPRLQELNCKSLSIREPVSNSVSLELIKRRLSQQLNPRTVTMELSSKTDETIAGLLLESAQSTIQILSLSLQYDRSSSISACIREQSWTMLRDITLRLRYSFEMPRGATSIKTSIEILKDFRPPSLINVTVVFPSPIGELLLRIASLRGYRRLCSELDLTLLSWPHSKLTFFSDRPTHSRRQHLWTQELSKHFPKMAERGSLIIFSRLETAVGHDQRIDFLVHSSDSQ
ncbi:hypothetical protein BD311DRAFT_732137 [Dichomitus squalens]|uniref:F-box domain-containing protein n=1 Tax=Dichomitus squalens TaxID=114155 RepID=A0A4Q9M998_9APHY|nr:hypothetical protein BD311DRAFT_732137 [Dichomitus squalens]